MGEWEGEQVGSTYHYGSISSIARTTQSVTLCYVAHANASRRHTLVTLLHVLRYKVVLMRNAVGDVLVGHIVSHGVLDVVVELHNDVWPACAG